MVKMAIIKKSKIREMHDAELQARLFEFQKELNSERGMIATGGRTSNPGKIKQLKRSIARILTIVHERKIGIVRKIKSAAATVQKPAAASGAKPAVQAGAKPAPAAAVAPEKKQ